MRSTPERPDGRSGPASPPRSVAALPAGGGLAVADACAEDASTAGRAALGGAASGGPTIDRARMRLTRIGAPEIGRIRLADRDGKR